MKRIRQASLLLVAALAGCSSEVTLDELSGEWIGQTLKQDFQFDHNGKTRLRDRKHGVYMGHCRIEDGNRLNCSFERFSQPVQRDIRLSGEELIMTDSNGHDEVYIRK